MAMQKFFIFHRKLFALSVQNFFVHSYKVDFCTFVNMWNIVTLQDCPHNTYQTVSYWKLVNLQCVISWNRMQENIRVVTCIALNFTWVNRMTIWTCDNKKWNFLLNNFYNKKMTTKGRYHRKKHVFFRTLPKKGGGLPMPEFFGPFFTK